MANLRDPSLTGRSGGAGRHDVGVSSPTSRRSAGWPRRFPVAQPPNPPLALAVAGAVASRLLDGEAADAASAVFYLFLGVWAYLEITDGVNWFRRALGVGVLVYLIVRLTAAL